MFYTVWDVETNNNGQVTAVILRNPWKSDTGLRNVIYADANPNDGLVRLTLAELSSSYRGSQLKHPVPGGLKATVPQQATVPQLRNRRRGR